MLIISKMYILWGVTFIVLEQVKP